MSTFEVTSEIYTESDYETIKTSDGRLISKFTFSYPTEVEVDGKQIIVDKDGDPILPRLKKDVIEIEHLRYTVLKLVGLQIWRGAFLLADFIIANRHTEFNQKNILELGAGVGLTSVVAGFYAKSIVCTDLDVGGILDLIKLNFKRNQKHIRCKDMRVMELDFMKTSSWSDDLLAVIDRTDVIFVADVIYSDYLTDAFIQTLETILNRKPENGGVRKPKTIYVALEKRYVFTLADMDTAAPCYEYFLQGFHKIKNLNPSWRIQSVPLDFPQYFDYERCKALVLWKIVN